MSMAFIDSEGGGGTNNNRTNVPPPPDTFRPSKPPSGDKALVRVEDLVINGRKVRRAFYDDGSFEDVDMGAAEDTNTGTRVKTSSRYEGKGANRVRYDKFNLPPLEEGPFADPETSTEEPGGGKKPRFYGTNPELLGSLNDYFAALSGQNDPRARNLIGYAQENIRGFIAGTFSYEDVFGSLQDISKQISAAIATDGDDDDGAASVVNQDSKALIMTYLKKYGLESLESYITDIMARGVTSESAVLFSLRETEAYKKRFAANAKRVANKLSELTPGTYVEMENTYREVMKANGMDAYFNRSDILENLIGGDVSARELQSRISEGYRRVREADPATKAQMLQLYQVNDADLAAYFLNPEEAMPVLTRRAEAARLAARGKEQGGIQLTSGTAEELASRGISEAQAFETFGAMAQKRGLYEALPGEETMDLEEQLGAAFGYDPMAQKRLAERVALRRSQFQGGGRFASTTGATQGTTETGAGTAQ
jgi:hypothetical protein